MDSLAQTFLSETTNISSLVAMTIGGLAYRLGKIAFLNTAPNIVRFASPLFGLVCEVTAFEGTSRFLQNLSPHSSPLTPHSFSEEWRNSFVDFAMMKSVGHLLRTHHLIGRHLVQDFSMIAGHQATAFLGWTPAPEGNFLDQMLHAEIKNLQLGIGTHLSAHLSGHRISSLERNFDRLPLYHSTLSPQIQHQDALQMHSETLDGNGSEPSRKLRNITYHSNFQAGWNAAPESIRSRTLRAIELIANGSITKGMDKKSLKGVSQPLHQIRINDHYRLLFTLRNRKYEMVHLGTHNETDRFIRQWFVNPLQESSNHTFNPFHAIQIQKSTEGEALVALPTEEKTQAPAMDWAAHWERVIEERQARKTPPPEENFEIEMANPQLADPAQVLSRALDGKLLAEFPELAGVEDESITELSEASALWRGDPDARLLFHLQSLGKQLRELPFLEPATKTALQDMAEAETMIEVAHKSDLPDIVTPLLEAYRQISSLDRLRLQVETNVWRNLDCETLRARFMEFILTREWGNEDLNYLIAQNLDAEQNPLETLAAWALHSPRKPFRSTQTSHSPNQSPHQRLATIYPELEFLDGVAAAPFRSDEESEWNTALHFWNEAPENFRRVLRLGSELFANKGSETRFYTVARHISAWARLGAPTETLTFYAAHALTHARTEDSKAIRSVLQADPMKWAVRCPEIREDPLAQMESPINNKDFQRFFNRRNACFTAILARIARHPELGETLSNRLWEAASDQELDGADMNRWLSSIHQKAAELYLKHRASLRGDLPSALGNPLLDPNESIHLALNIPEEFPEILGFNLSEMDSKSDRIKVILAEHDPDSTPILMDHVKRYGIIRNTALTTDAYAALERVPAETPITLNGRTELRGKILSARPYTPTYRFALLLFSIAGPDMKRLMSIGLNFEHSFRTEALKLANRAGNLLLAGAPHSWVIYQFFTRFTAAYRASRRKTLQEIEDNFPSFFETLYRQLPEYDLLGANLSREVMLENGLDRNVKDHLDVLTDLAPVFRRYEQLSIGAAGEEMTAKPEELESQILRGMARTLITHHSKFRGMLKLPFDLQTLMNTFSLVFNKADMPELFEPSSYFDNMERQVTPPPPVRAESQIVKIYYRVLVFMEHARSSETNVEAFMSETLACVAKEKDGIHTVLTALEFYFIHRKKILAHAPPFLR